MLLESSLFMKRLSINKPEDLDLSSTTNIQWTQEPSVERSPWVGVHDHTSTLYLTSKIFCEISFSPSVSRYTFPLLDFSSNEFLFNSSLY